MIEQSKLLECMEEIKAIAVSQQGRLTKEEVQKYLSDMEMDDNQMKAVYQYLSANQIVVEGYQAEPEVQPVCSDGGQGQKESDGLGHMESSDLGNSSSVEEDAGESPADNTKPGRQKLTKAQRNLIIYQQEVQALEGIEAEQEVELFRQFLMGEARVRNEIMQGHLQYVLQIAEEYKERNALLEEIIAEGNMGLLNAMTVLEQGKDSFWLEEGIPDMVKIKSVIEMEIRQAMEMMIDGMTEEKDWENALVAKINLLHEAAKYLAQELGRTATVEELAEYTRLSVQEIQDILDLSENTKKSIL